MIEQILGFLELAGTAISVAAVAVIIVGFALAMVRFVLRFQAQGPERDFERFKVELGRTLTQGLEILVLADVIETITVEPTFRSLIVLAFLVVIRTALSWTLALETEGRWPWQPAREDEGHA